MIVIKNRLGYIQIQEGNKARFDVPLADATPFESVDQAKSVMSRFAYKLEIFDYVDPDIELKTKDELKLAANLVIKRDKGVCVRCGELGEEVHHIIPRSRTNKGNPAPWLNKLENLALLCRDCHGEAHTRPARVFLLNRLKERHGYDYSGSPFSEYI